MTTHTRECLDSNRCNCPTEEDDINDAIAFLVARGYVVVGPNEPIVDDPAWLRAEVRRQRQVIGVLGKYAAQLAAASSSVALREFATALAQATDGRPSAETEAIPLTGPGPHSAEGGPDLYDPTSRQWVMHPAQKLAVQAFKKDKP
jgi:hypothetical protein